MSGEAPSGFTMLGATDASACEGDACLVPGSAQDDTTETDEA